MRDPIILLVHIIGYPGPFQWAPACLRVCSWLITVSWSMQRLRPSESLVETGRRTPARRIWILADVCPHRPCARQTVGSNSSHRASSWATILEKFRRALCTRKYGLLFSGKRPSHRAPKDASKALGATSDGVNAGPRISRPRWSAIIDARTPAVHQGHALEHADTGEPELGISPASVRHHFVEDRHRG